MTPRQARDRCPFCDPPRLYVRQGGPVPQLSPARRPQEIDTHSALVMIKPDGVLQGLTGAVVAWLEQRGYQPVRYREVMLDPDRLALLYPASPGSDLDVELACLLFDLAPVRVLLLSGPPSAAGVLTCLKGSHTPDLDPPGTLRRDVGALNRYCTLVHAAPDTVTVRRETELLIDRSDDLADLWRACAEPARPISPWDVLERALARLTGTLRAEVRLRPEAGATTESCHGTEHLRRRWAVLAQSVAGVDPGLATWLRDVRDGHVSYRHWHAQTESLATAAAWPSYLAFTTLRSMAQRRPEPAG